MTETSTNTVRLTDGRSLDITVAEPENSVRGGIVVLHEGDEVHDLLGSFAAEGWLTVSPHLFHDGRNLDGDSVLDDLDAACVWLSQREITTDRIGVLGFDLGAAVAAVVAAKRSVGAVVSVAGPGIGSPRAGLPALVDVAGAVSCPWLGMYGESDTQVAAADVERLKSAAAGAGVANDVVRFAAGDHRFDTGAETTDEARQRALNWFDSHLR